MRHMLAPNWFGRSCSHSLGRTAGSGSINKTGTCDNDGHCTGTDACVFDYAADAFNACCENLCRP